MDWQVEGNKVAIGAIALGEVWRTAPMVGPKRETSWSGECFTCSWVAHGYGHRDRALGALMAHIERKHRALFDESVLCDSVGDDRAALL
jgi:hypothetical protein